MRAAARRPIHQAGFTLVEVLLVLVLMGGIMTLIAQILTVARTSRDTIHNIQETQLAGPAILDLVERDLRAICIYDRTRKLHLRVKNRVLAGLDGDSIDFVASSRSRTPAVIDDRFVRSTVSEVGYRLRIRPNDDQFLEIWRREQFGVDEDPFEGGEYQYLHERVKSFDVQCFTEDGPDAEPVEEWGTDRADENIGLPARIEITLVLELAPKIVNEQLRYLSSERRTQTYRRIIRIPEILRSDEESIPVPRIPSPPAAGAGAGAGTSPVGGAAGGGGARPSGPGSGSGARPGTAIDEFRDAPGGPGG